ncbi:MAG: Asp-tRNA(Asn)/Glu-tRNA(Gln) amidotransferase subunit GatC [Flavobacteriales bacterium]|nr:Asp-tRNA(Asn)/Glu-tRNA(Gln) amidotransferase subunit GatC [Flavobacteriales bacterium]
MIIDDKTVDKIAVLSKLKFEGEAKENIKSDMNKMLEFVSKLDEIDTEGVQPLVYMTDELNVLREDDARNTLTQKEALKNAPKKDSDYFRVPKVLSK